MRLHRLMPMALLLSLMASAQDAATNGSNQTPSVKWRGSFWASVLTEERQSMDGTLVFRPLESGEDRFSLDGLSVGADVALPEGFSLRFTALAGQMGKNINILAGESGSVAVPEAMLVWTGKRDILRFGRMLTFIGMESTDQTVGVAASKGILFTYADPCTQVGLAWHHSFSAAWSSDLWIFNGEDRVSDNNHGKTVGLGITYNHGGSADDYVSLQAYRGPEQDGLGAKANTGAEGRMRERLCMMGQWIWGAATLQWEGNYGREKFGADAIQGATEPKTATWVGGGAIFKYAFSNRSAMFARAETLKDDLGVRLGFDTSIAPIANRMGADLRLSSFALGYERKFGSAFARFEVRQDALNRDLTDLDGKSFKSGTSATLLLGASF